MVAALEKANSKNLWSSFCGWITSTEENNPKLRGPLSCMPKAYEKSKKNKKNFIRSGGIFTLTTNPHINLKDTVLFYSLVIYQTLKVL